MARNKPGTHFGIPGVQTEFPLPARQDVLEDPDHYPDLYDDRARREELDKVSNAVAHVMNG